MTRARAGLVMAGLLAIFVALAAWYSVTVPLGEAPDEVPHFTYVRYLARHGRLPGTTDEHEAFQPPLYYALGAALTFWIVDEPGAPFAVRANADFDFFDARSPKNLLLHTAAESWPYRGWAAAWHVVRLLSVALGTVTVWAVYRLGLALFPGPAATIPVAMAAVVAFTPQFLFMSAVVNNDNAATAASAVVLWQAAALLRAGPGAGRGSGESTKVWLVRVAALGVSLGLALLSKANLIALLPVAGLAVVAAQARRAAWPRWLLPAGASGALAFGLAGALAGWYFVRNWVLHGDPLGWSFLLQINAPRQGPLTLDVLAWLVRGVFRTFWLGWIGIAFENAVYWALAAACAAAAAGFAAWLWRRWRSLDAALRAALGLFALYAVIVLGSLIKWTMTVDGTDQGRLIYPLLPLVALVLAAGWAWWGGVVRAGHGPLLAGLVAGLFGLAVVTPVCYLAPVYAPAPVASAAELAAAVPLDARWGDVRLLAYRLEDNRVAPGGKLMLHLYWQAGRPIAQDVMALIQVVDAGGQFLMFTDGSPTAGRDTPDRWRPGVPLASRHLLPIPDYAPPGEYRVTISLHPFGQTAWLPVYGPDGARLGDHLTLPEIIHIGPAP